MTEAIREGKPVEAQMEMERLRGLLAKAEDIIEGVGGYALVVWNQRRDAFLSTLDGNSAANALNSAAPDLYAALDAIHTELLKQDIKFGPLTGAAEEALAKARGESA